MLSASLCRSLPNSIVLQIPAFVRWNRRVGGRSCFVRYGKVAVGSACTIEAESYLSSRISQKDEGIDCVLFALWRAMLGIFILELGYRI
jgi:hypothetical protein